jgi:hypothetical protein
MNRPADWVSSGAPGDKASAAIEVFEASHEKEDEVLAQVMQPEI